MDLAWKAYGEAKAAAWKAYQGEIAAAWKAYQGEIAAAGKAYQEATPPAWNVQCPLTPNLGRATCTAERVARTSSRGVLAAAMSPGPACRTTVQRLMKRPLPATGRLVGADLGHDGIERYRWEPFT